MAGVSDRAVAFEGAMDLVMVPVLDEEGAMAEVWDGALAGHMVKIHTLKDGLGLTTEGPMPWTLKMRWKCSEMRLMP